MAPSRISEHLESGAQAIRAKDLDSLMSHYAPDCVVFDLMPLQTLGRDAYRKNFESWFGSVEGSIEFEIRDLTVEAREDIGVAHYTSRVSCTRLTGERPDYEVRVTAVLRTRNSRWLITHEHGSLPFAGPEALQAALTAATPLPRAPIQRPPGSVQ